MFRQAANHHIVERAPRLVLLMGVAGSGKTTLGRQLAEHLGYAFVDADAFHSSAAIERMRSGQPLPDALREAWVERLAAALAVKHAQGIDCVLAFSGLRARHRRRLMQLGFITTAFMLQGGANLLALRLTQRQDHFMPATQLQDQLVTMQPLEADEQVECIDVGPDPQGLVAALANKVALGL